jgi:hypothetical protein
MDNQMMRHIIAITAVLAVSVIADDNVTKLEKYRRMLSATVAKADAELERQKEELNAQLQRQQKLRDSRVIKAMKRYAKALGKLQGEYTRAADLDNALAVRDELRRVNALIHKRQPKKSNPAIHLDPVNVPTDTDSQVKATRPRERYDLNPTLAESIADSVWTWTANNELAFRKNGTVTGPNNPRSVVGSWVVTGTDSIEVTIIGGRGQRTKFPLAFDKLRRNYRRSRSGQYAPFNGKRVTSKALSHDKLPEGVWWIYLDYPDGVRRRHKFTFGKKIIIDGRELTPVKNPKGIVLVDRKADWAELWVKTAAGYDVLHWSPAKKYKSSKPLMKGKAKWTGSR